MMLEGFSNVPTIQILLNRAIERLDKSKVYSEDDINAALGIEATHIREFTRRLGWKDGFTIKNGKPNNYWVHADNEGADVLKGAVGIMLA